MEYTNTALSWPQDATVAFASPICGAHDTSRTHAAKDKGTPMHGDTHAHKTPQDTTHKTHKRAQRVLTLVANGERFVDTPDHLLLLCLPRAFVDLDLILTAAHNHAVGLLHVGARLSRSSTGPV